MHKVTAARMYNPRGYSQFRRILEISDRRLEQCSSDLHYMKGRVGGFICSNGELNRVGSSWIELETQWKASWLLF
ncbi:hypothetical protein EMPS_09923 [Entomortierella parvispora]|uniref:Uncharacterized protein n=1 Tax=Entomortierella parvispora TaxID=205924 RepID=A0A9P3HIY2_9FUNG|nr:hypothetical protein EMPS_09923 [Entomortierella parvispora]